VIIAIDACPEHAIALSFPRLLLQRSDRGPRESVTIRERRVLASRGGAGWQRGGGREVPVAAYTAKRALSEGRVEPAAREGREAEPATWPDGGLC